MIGSKAVTMTDRFPSSTSSIDHEIVRLERAALTRWCKGDPSGFLEISAPDIVYFDPFVPKRVDGLEALSTHYGPLRGKIFADTFELINPCVQAVGDLAVLTFNYVSSQGTSEQRWNCTEVYRRDSVGWRIIQSHWSLTSRA